MRVEHGGKPAGKGRRVKGGGRNQVNLGLLCIGHRAGSGLVWRLS
jgi:hypothetical protein